MSFEGITEFFSQDPRAVIVSPPFLKRNLTKVMESRRSQFKSTATRSTPYARKPKYGRSYSNRRRRRPTFSRPLRGVGDSSITMMNTGGSKYHTISRTVSAPFSINGVIAGTPGWTFIFDPSGTYSTFAGATAGALAAMPDWTSLVGIFDQYRVNYVKVRWSVVSTNASIPVDDANVTMLSRYNYEAAVVTPTYSGMMNTSGVKRKAFCSQSPMLEDLVYPKYLLDVRNTGVLSAQGAAVAKPTEFLDVNNPCQLWGYQFVLGNGIPDATTKLWADIEYNVTFKYDK